MDMSEAFGKAVRQTRKERGVQQEAVGPSQSYISEVERGLKTPSLVKAQEIADALGVDLVTLIARAVLLQNPGMTPALLIAQLQRDLGAK
ncbi:helix-turn-helix domain-containing protein [Pseudomonas sp. PDM19]|uniref:helix-turn-helix domain-containing protein n=1 Tax=Pseudomonas sp. PDM19 TaxID=2769272 RepID=UPI0017869BC6|nr:helix-turn-helix transcriptional regulator [Pseudomonas sp. PDM19]MBD9634627.1 helix-turn-helix transcriptional regulator [Pseudomonas sp. PDM19]